jgi:hypothetical protein
MLASAKDIKKTKELVAHWKDHEWGIVKKILKPTVIHRFNIGGKGRSPYSNETVLTAMEDLVTIGTFAGAARAKTLVNSVLHEGFKMRTPSYHLLKYFSLQMIEDTLISTEKQLIKELTKVDGANLFIETDVSTLHLSDGDRSLLACNMYGWIVGNDVRIIYENIFFNLFSQNWNLQSTIQKIKSLNIENMKLE